MKQPPQTKPVYSSSDKIKIILVSIFLAILLVIFGILLGILLRHSGFQFSSRATPISSPIVVAPTVLAPTVVCSSNTFVLDTTTFQIQGLPRTPDGPLNVPPAASGIAYWLETVEGNYLVILSPTPENISLETTLTAENSASVFRADCSSMSFNLLAPEQKPANISTLLNQLTPGLTIFFQTDTSGNGLIARGELTEITFP